LEIAEEKDMKVKRHDNYYREISQRRNAGFEIYEVDCRKKKVERLVNRILEDRKYG